MKKSLYSSFSALGVFLALSFFIAHYITFPFLSSTASGSLSKACTHYYQAVAKGTKWQGGEWHHYVEFDLSATQFTRQLQIIAAPLPASFWQEYSTPTVKRVWYSWPSNWWDPFPLTAWKICQSNS